VHRHSATHRSKHRTGIGPGSRSARPAGRQRGADRGFTLIEVLVALFIMAILAGMAWQGIDGMVRTRDGARDRGEQVLQMGTVMAQWEQDLSQIQQSAAAPPLRFDGAALRLTRRTPDGLQLVVWTRQGDTLYRWASPPLTRVRELQDWWLRSQQWSAISDRALRMLASVSAWQIYYYQLGDNSWSNAQSTGNVALAPQAPASGASAPEDDNGAVLDDVLPIGVRLVLSVPSGDLTRDLMLTGSQ
jgi:general secretion pathway protein J